MQTASKNAFAASYETQQGQEDSTPKYKEECLVNLLVLILHPQTSIVDFMLTSDINNIILQKIPIPIPVTPVPGRPTDPAQDLQKRCTMISSQILVEVCIA